MRCAGQTWETRERLSLAVAQQGIPAVTRVVQLEMGRQVGKVKRYL